MISLKNTFWLFVLRNKHFYFALLRTSLNNFSHLTKRLASHAVVGLFINSLQLFTYKVQSFKKSIQAGSCWLFGILISLVAQTL